MVGLVECDQKCWWWELFQFPHVDNGIWDHLKGMEGCVYDVF